MDLMLEINGLNQMENGINVYQNGKMAKNTVIDGYQLNENGEWV